jgi:ferredoxin-NADP reductase
MALPKKIIARVLRVENFEETLSTVVLESLEKPFKFDPGQFLHLAIDEYDPAGQWPDSRCFSIQSPPENTDLKFTYSVKGSFTSRMKVELKPGKIVTLKLPYGDLFMKQHNIVNTVFIAGGTGITPFLSLFTSQRFLAYNKPVLYAAFRNREMNHYNDQLGIASGINSQLKVNYIFQDTDGLIDIEKVYENNAKDASYFISGPPQMIKIFKNQLILKGLQADQILTDDWE